MPAAASSTRSIGWVNRARKCTINGHSLLRLKLFNP
jgi:hypothetical protein